MSRHDSCFELQEGVQGPDNGHAAKLAPVDIKWFIFRVFVFFSIFGKAELAGRRLLFQKIEKLKNRRIEK